LIWTKTGGQVLTRPSPFFNDSLAKFETNLSGLFLAEMQIRRFTYFLGCLPQLDSKVPTERPQMGEQSQDQSKSSEGSVGESANHSAQESGKSALSRALTSESFIEKLALLVIAALLSGIVAPIVITVFNAQDAARQKEREANRARNEAILQAQSNLLTEFSDVIFTYETLALDVSWYRTEVGMDKERYETAYPRYSDRVIDLFAKWRSLTSRARALGSKQISNEMLEFHRRVLVNQDTPINTLHRNGGDVQWQQQHNYDEQVMLDAFNRCYISRNP
jgi:hypothetical protein